MESPNASYARWLQPHPCPDRPAGGPDVLQQSRGRRDPADRPRDRLRLREAVLDRQSALNARAAFGSTVAVARAVEIVLVFAQAVDIAVALVLASGVALCITVIIASESLRPMGFRRGRSLQIAGRD
jgi:hypothetical protein